MQGSDIISDFLGIDILKLDEEKSKNEEKAKELAIAIVKLTECPEWEIFAKELERMKSFVDRPCEEYAGKSNLVWTDVGYKGAIETIQRFISNQHNIVEKYAKENKEGDQG